jgi:hypothetical protein
MLGVACSGSRSRTECAHQGAIFTLCSDIAEIGLVPAVERLVREQAARAGWAANVVVRGAVPELPVLVQFPLASSIIAHHTPMGTGRLTAGVQARTGRNVSR